MQHDAAETAIGFGIRLRPRADRTSGRSCNRKLNFSPLNHITLHDHRARRLMFWYSASHIRFCDSNHCCRKGRKSFTASHRSFLNGEPRGGVQKDGKLVQRPARHQVLAVMVVVSGLDRGVRASCGANTAFRTRASCCWHSSQIRSCPCCCIPISIANSSGHMSRLVSSRGSDVSGATLSSSNWIDDK